MPGPDSKAICLVRCDLAWSRHVDARRLQRGGRSFESFRAQSDLFHRRRRARKGLSGQRDHREAASPLFAVVARVGFVDALLRKEPTDIDLVLVRGAIFHC